MDQDEDPPSRLAFRSGGAADRSKDTTDGELSGALASFTLECVIGTVPFATLAQCTGATALAPNWAADQGWNTLLIQIFLNLDACEASIQLETADRQTVFFDLR